AGDRGDDTRTIRCTDLQVLVDELRPGKVLARAVRPVAELHGQVDRPDLERRLAAELRTLEQYARTDRDRDRDLADPHVDRDTRRDAGVHLDREAERIEVDDAVGAHDEVRPRRTELGGDLEPAASHHGFRCQCEIRLALDDDRVADAPVEAEPRNDGVALAVERWVVAT